MMFAKGFVPGAIALAPLAGEGNGMGARGVRCVSIASGT